MTGPKVRCRDCAEYKGERCEVKMKYMNPKTPRYCKAYKPTEQLDLLAWVGAGLNPEHWWPP